MIKIRSKTKIITNSSSETFIVRRPSGKEPGDLELELENLTRKVFKEFHNQSGTGGNIEVIGKEQIENDCFKSMSLEEYLCASYGVYDLPEDLEDFLLIDIDWGFQETINWIMKNLEVIFLEPGFPVASKDSRRIEDNWENSKRDIWDALPDHPYLPNTKMI